jgi:hypothetical protein
MLKSALILLLIACGLLQGCSSINAEKHEIPAIDHGVSLLRLPVCYNHGCSIIEDIQVSKTLWEKISDLFSSTQSDFDERLAIRNAIALLEKEAARFTPVGVDAPKNSNEDAHGRQDCVDESTNTTHFLKLMEKQQLLKWHRVGTRVYRAHFLIDQHYAAQIIHLHSGERYVVDSWYLSNGEMPYIQPYRSWVLKKSFSAFENPDV